MAALTTASARTSSNTVLVIKRRKLFPKLFVDHIIMWAALLLMVTGGAMGCVYLMVVDLPLSKSTHFAQTHVWAHRGGAEGLKLPENSPEAVARSFAAGFNGVELDVFYDLNRKSIIVSHDRHYVRHQGKIISLRDLVIPDQSWVWLDLKNLNEMNVKDIAEFVNLLSDLELAERTYVESPEFMELVSLDQHGATTVYWMSADHERSPFYFIAIKSLTWLFGIDAISISYQNLDVVRKHFGASSIFTFTVNSKAEVCRLVEIKAVAVILTKLTYSHGDGFCAH